MGRSVFLLIALAVLASAIVNDVDASRHRRHVKAAAAAKKIALLKKIPVAAKSHIAKIPVVGTLLGLHKAHEIPHIGTYPLWKVHRYHGISLQPVPYPGERIPSELPVPPTLPGEAPSIVNVPNPHYAPVDAPAPPANEYGAPPSPPVPEYGVPPSPPAPEYGVPPSPPAPEYGVPPAPAPYSAASSSAQANSGAYSGSGSSANAFANSASSAGAYAGSGSAAYAGSGELDLSTLQAFLPPELFTKVQLYASTPGGHERVAALLGIANNARKLKFNAAHSIQGMFQKLFGGAGGSTDVALNSGTWTSVPEIYPSHQGIFNQFRAIGTGISGSSLPILPEVPALPKIPGLHTLPPPPKLPHINLPEISPLSGNGLGGSYVSVQFPQAPQLKEAPPAQQYGPPAEQYGPPAPQYSPPAPQYSPPAPQYSPQVSQYFPPAPQYSPPAPQYSPPTPQYSVPEIPSTSYGTPVGPVYSYPQSSGGASSSFFQAPRQTYGAPDASFAASEANEQYEGRHGGSGGSQEEEEDNETQPEVPLKTTKLQKVEDSRPLRGEALRAYLDSRRSFMASHKDQNNQADNEVNEDGQD